MNAGQPKELQSQKVVVSLNSHSQLIGSGAIAGRRICRATVEPRSGAGIRNYSVGICKDTAVVGYQVLKSRGHSRGLAAGILYRMRGHEVEAQLSYPQNNQYQNRKNESKLHNALARPVTFDREVLFQIIFPVTTIKVMGRQSA